MLKKVESALLLSDVSSFIETYRELAEEAEVYLQVESNWNKRYRVNTDIVILGTKHIDNINETYYNKVVLILKDGESPAPYIKMGINRFIFNYKCQNELLFAFYGEKTVEKASGRLGEYETILHRSRFLNFKAGDYDFKFDLNQFSYKGKYIYLTEGAKIYIAKWLLEGNKDNSKRMILYNLRKSLGKDFMSDIDRFGQYNGGIK